MIDEHDRLARRLRAHAAQLDAQTAPIATGDVEARAGSRLRRGFPRSGVGIRAAAAVAVVGVLVIGTVVAWVVTHESDRSAPRLQGPTPSTVPLTKSASESVHPEPWTGSPLYLEPSLPPGFRLVHEEGGYGLGASSNSGTLGGGGRQFWVRFNEGHMAALAELDIGWGEGTLSPYRFGSVAIVVRGHLGRYQSHRNDGLLAWEEPAGHVNTIGCTRCSRSELLRIAAGLVQRANGSWRWPHPIGGFEFINTAPAYSSSGTQLRQLDYEGPNHTSVSIGIVNNTQDPPFDQLGLPDTSITLVRGVRGIDGTQINAFLNGAFVEPKPTFFVEWLEYPNIKVTVAGAKIQPMQLETIANSLHPIDEKQWTHLGATTVTCCNTVVTAATAPNG